MVLVLGSVVGGGNFVDVDAVAAAVAGAAVWLLRVRASASAKGVWVSGLCCAKTSVLL